MSKIRVYELAKQINKSSKEVIELLYNEFGIEVKNHMSVIEGEDANIIKEYLEELNAKKENKLNEQEKETTKTEEHNEDNEFDDLGLMDDNYTKNEKIRKNLEVKRWNKLKLRKKIKMMKKK